MSLVHIKNQLYKAQKSGYAVPMFDVFEMQGADGVFEAIEEKKAPAIVAVYAFLIDSPNAEAFAAYLKTRAESLTMPVSIMLDHGQTIEQCMRAISFGFTDIMFDGSALPIEDNIAQTCEVVRAAHPLGIGVEAELGHVGNAANYETFAAKKEGFTEPASVAPFVKATGVDFLAVAFGTAHGVSQSSSPQIDLDLLREIRTRVDIPLVMHGGSGLTDQQFRDVIAAGVAKINVATNLVIGATAAIKETAAQEAANLFTIAAAARESYKNNTTAIFDLFGATGKGEQA